MLRCGGGSSPPGPLREHSAKRRILALIGIARLKAPLWTMVNARKRNAYFSSAKHWTSPASSMDQIRQGQSAGFISRRS
jgi:hypothetical protein